jgi:Flp pilus assembly protein TadD
LIRGCSAALVGAFCLLSGGLPTALWAQQPAATQPGTEADLTYWPPANPRELLALDEPMKRFFSARVDPHGPDGECLRMIVDAIVRPEGLNFAYEPNGIYDAREAFHRRRGNCLAFSFLVVAVAREYKLKVQFQDIDTTRGWNRFDRFIAAIRHMNVRLTTADDTYVADLRPDLAAVPVSDNQYVVDDRRAFAHFYTTAGFFRLVNGDNTGALHLMKLAVETDPRSTVVWTNLGNLHLRLEELDMARRCFEQSLRLDSRGEQVLVSLVEVLRRQGRAEDLQLAAKHERRAQALRVRNPYYHGNLAWQARADGALEAAEQHLRQAIRLKGDEPIFQEALVEVLRELGRVYDAQRVDARLAKLRKKLGIAAERLIP